MDENDLKYVTIMMYVLCYRSQRQSVILTVMEEHTETPHTEVTSNGVVSPRAASPVAIATKTSYEDTSRHEDKSTPGDGLSKAHKRRSLLAEEWEKKFGANV